MSSTSLKFTAAPSMELVTGLLQEAELPTSDLTAEHLKNFFICGATHAPSGLIGLELYGGDALLRSLVVSKAERARGLGSALVARIEQHARERGVQSVYLLTTTAKAFFERLGYQSVAREAAPQSIRATPEFASICPASSAFMVKRLVSAS